jgi:riboflavin synthase
MFTGIVAAVGRIEKLTSLAASENTAAGMRLTIAAGELDLSDVVIGDSIAIQGACMTAIALRRNADRNEFDVDVSLESFSKTVGLDQLGEVNLEKALALGDRLGGHMVSGHVDGLGRVVRFDEVAESWHLDVLIPKELAKYFANKGSATINGVSLTTNRVLDTAEGAVISINLIPHTIAVTTLRNLRVGDQVNVEIDLIARYIERMLMVSSHA